MPRVLRPLTNPHLLRPLTSATSRCSSVTAMLSAVRPLESSTLMEGTSPEERSCLSSEVLPWRANSNSLKTKRWISKHGVG